MRPDQPIEIGITTHYNVNGDMNEHELGVSHGLRITTAAFCTPSLMREV